MYIDITRRQQKSLYIFYLDVIDLVTRPQQIKREGAAICYTGTLVSISEYVFSAHHFFIPVQLDNKFQLN